MRCLIGAEFSTGEQSGCVMATTRTTSGTSEVAPLPRKTGADRKREREREGGSESESKRRGGGGGGGERD